MSSPFARMHSLISPALLLGGCLLTACVASPARAQVININFDTDANGAPLTAPTVFSDTQPLTTLYSPLGVTFSGPAPGSGGAILDQGSSFTFNARSGRNFLAFNRLTSYAGGGTPTDPETIRLDFDANSISVFAVPGSNDGTFTLSAFDANNVLVGSDTLNLRVNVYGQLSVSGAGIRSALLTETGASFFAYDDLRITSVPEPGSLAFMGVLSLCGGWCFHRRYLLRSSPR